MNNEWNAKLACDFWPDQRGHWAPVSWKDHLYDFNVFYNGTILADPGGLGLNRNIPPEDQAHSGELRVAISANEPTAESLAGQLMSGFLPDARHIASWAKGAAPQLVIEHCMHNAAVYVEQRQFAHVPGGQRVRRGDEPHFLWVRFVVSDVVEIINSFEHVYVALTWLRPSLCTGMGAFNNINFNYGYEAPAYPTPLHLTDAADPSKPAHLLIAPRFRFRDTTLLYGKRNRLAFPARNRGVSVSYLRSTHFGTRNKPLGHLILKLPAKRGAKVDLVVPVTPVDDATMNRELALGYDAALRETEKFWKAELKTKTSVRVSEPLLQGWIDNFPRLEAMIAEIHPATGEYGIPSGSYHYEAIWATPFALCSWALDALGHGDEVDKYLETYRLHQGTIAPPSPYLKPHPGYLGSPKTFTSIDWITDHAAILWAAASHGLMSMDRDFLKRWVSAIVKACEFTKYARRFKDHKGYKGILPPSVANDCKTSSQSGWNDAWHHKALRTAVLLLERIGNPRAREFRNEANEYRAAFQKAYRDTVKKSKRWKAPDGTLVPFTPPTLSEAQGFEAAHAFHLDTGAMALVFGELFPASDPIMQAAVRWFREGPQVRHFRKNSSEWQPPVLYGEISSCEPCYSWNIFHTLELGDREKFTQGLYGLFAGGGNRQTFVACETQNAVSGNCFTHGPALMLMRQAVIEERENELHLLRMAPLAFFAAGGFEWKNMPTWFGELSIAACYDETARALIIRYGRPSRSKPVRTVLHVPSFENLANITLNGKSLGKVKTVEL